MHSITEVAEAAGLKAQDLRTLVRTGVIEAKRVGGAWVLSDEARIKAIEYGKKRRLRRNNKNRAGNQP